MKIRLFSQIKNLTFRRPKFLGVNILTLLSCMAFVMEANAINEPPAQQWSEIAKEAQDFTTPAGIIIRYGTREKYTTKKSESPGIVKCNNKTFGDPTPYIQKSCYVEKITPELKLISSGLKTADEHATFRAVAGSIIRYGAGQSWKTRVVGANSVCNNRYFGGDPAPGVIKACYENVGDNSYLKPPALLSAYSDATDRGNSTIVQLNVAGAEFTPQQLPGKEGTHYIFPDATYLNKWQKGNIKIIRFPILWERLQPVPNEPFNASYANGIDDFLERAAQRNMSVIIDIHNYGRYYNEVIGTPSVPTVLYGDFMKRIALRWGSNPGLHGYDLMNEPYGDADRHWKANAQAGIDAIRMHDRVHPIYVEGRTWSNITNFPELNADLLLLDDPINNLVYSAHLYLDEGSSGQYQNKITGNFDPMIGVNRAKPFVEWLIRNNKRGQIGEFGVPGDDPRWLKSLDNVLSYLHENCVPMAYWAAGPWWGNYPLSVEPSNGVLPSQWSVLDKWTKSKAKKCL